MDEKAAHPPSYPQGAPPPMQPQMTGGQYPQGAPPQGYYPMQTPQAGMPGYPQMAPMQTPMATGGYPAQPQVVPQQTIVQVQPDLGTQYQQQLFARCARGDHDVTVRYGPCGIIAAIVFFPIGLIFLFLDVERKCARCGANLG
ncbi:hypothetical protein NLI96_g1243 [Meripilus lineatus]|uniref:Brain protein I3 n=1 Tax=Meripilus lineatus TaxID=2056292 RepID=A0AAD5YIK5_9APHY|nr:hypothetical protein NLI96_g1243 [Physisporinus lineatus]